MILLIVFADFCPQNRVFLVVYLSVSLDRISWSDFCKMPTISFYPEVVFIFHQHAERIVCVLEYGEAVEG
jgi:hypothetical protein